MKYFTASLWMEINHTDEEHRFKARKLWEENAQKYHQYFKSIRCHIPKYLLKEMDICYGFHDYDICAISIQPSTNKKICVLEIENQEKRFFIKMIGLKNANIQIDSFKNCVLGKLRWGYSEFEWTDMKTLRFSILCDFNNELQFEFEKISLENIQHRRHRGRVCVLTSD